MTAAYATQDDIVALYGADALFVADRDGDGVAEAPAVARALASASEEINSFLAVRYPLPLTSTPGVLVQKTVDIALYRLALSKDVQSVEHRQRYEDALAWLKALGKGEVSLMLPANGDLEGESPSQPEAPAPIVVAGPERLFSRAAMRGVP
jgi:phage gp36-like protein